MDRDFFSQSILEPLSNNDITALDNFEKFLGSEMDKYLKIECTHEFIDLLTFKLKQSKSSLDKSVLAKYLFELVNKTFKQFGYNSKFLSTQFKALVTYYKAKKEYDDAIMVLEFLVQNGITDDESQKFHIQLDDMFRLRKKYLLKAKRSRG